MMNTQQPMLIVRDEVQPGESLQSLLIRLAKLNYYSSVDNLSQILHEGVGESRLLKDRIIFPSQAETFQGLATLTGINIADLYAASAHHFAGVLTPPDNSIKFLTISGDTTEPLLASVHAMKLLRPGHAGQYCPLCLEEAAYHRLVWMPVATSVCLRHTCLLVDHCPRCKKSVSIQEIVDAQCRKCKSNLTKAGLIFFGNDMNDVGLRFQRIFQMWFMKNAFNDVTILQLPEYQPRVLYRFVYGLQWATRMLAGVEWPYLHRIGVDSPTLLFQQNGKHRTITPYESYCLYTTAGKGLLNWPEGFYEFLDAYRDQVLPYKLHNGGPQADLGYLYKLWMRDYWQHPTFKFVHKAFEHYFIRSYSLNSAVARTNFFQENPAIIQQLSYVSVSEAARLLGITTKMIDVLLRAGDLTYQTSGSTGKRKYRLISRTEVLELRSRWNDVVQRAEAAEWLGTTEEMVIDLVNADLLVAEFHPEDGYPHWLFRRSALVDCREKVFKYVEVCIPQKTGEKGAFVDLAGAAHLLFVIGLKAIAIVCRVVEGQLRAYYIADQKPALRSLLFDRADIQQYIQAVKLENGWIGRKEVTRLLKVNDGTLKRWVQLGLFSPTIAYG